MNKLMMALSATLLLASIGCSSDRKESKNNPESLTKNAMVTPAAEGNVQTSVDKNGNTQLNVNVKHLAEPSMLSQGAQNYVVWILPQGSTQYQNVGTLKVNDNLEGNYSTKVPHKNFHLMITPESSMTVSQPSGVTVLEKSVNI